MEHSHSSQPDKEESPIQSLYNKVSPFISNRILLSIAFISVILVVSATGRYVLDSTDIKTFLIKTSPTPSQKVTVTPNASPSQAVVPATPSATPKTTLISTTPSPTVTTFLTITPTKTASTTQNSTQQTAKIFSVSPSSASWQQDITVQGSGFGSNPGYVAWFYNGQEIPYSPHKSWSDTEIIVPVAGAGSNMDYQIQVVKNDKTTSNKLNFHVIQGQPAISGMNPMNLAPGETVTITGSRFGSQTGGVFFAPSNDYSFNNKLFGEVQSWSDTQIVLKIPSSLEQGKEYIVVVQASSGSQSSVVFYKTAN